MHKIFSLMDARMLIDQVEASKAALDAAGIEIPYRHIQLFVENVDGRVWDQAAKLPMLAGGGGAAS